MIASSSPSSGSNTPPLASKQAANTIASSLPRCSAMACSSSRCSVCAPQMKRTEAMPKPNASIALLAAAIDLGMIGEAEVIVGAEIDASRARRPPEATCIRPPCGPGDQALALDQPRRLDLVERRADMAKKGVGHGSHSMRRLGRPQGAPPRRSCRQRRSFAPFDHPLAAMHGVAIPPSVVRSPRAGRGRGRFGAAPSSPSPRRLAGDAPRRRRGDGPA